jgi:hypothetical protein
MNINLKTALIFASVAFGLNATQGFGAHAQSSNQVAVVTDRSATGELAFWNSIKDSSSPTDFRAYLENFPDGMFFDPALERFERAGGQRSELPPSVFASVGDGNIQPLLDSGNVTSASKSDDTVIPQAKPKKKAAAKPAQKKSKKAAATTSKAKPKKKAAVAKKSPEPAPQCANGASAADGCVIVAAKPKKKKKPVLGGSSGSGGGWGGGGGGSSGGGNGWGGG